jgi:trehalose/maltose transport system substrate-binding protein
LTFLDVEWDTPDEMPALANDLRDFTRETGIEVKRLPRPDGSLNQLALWRELLAKGGPTPDVLSIDVIWPAMLSQYLVDLKPYFGGQLSKEDAAVVRSYTVGDKLVAMPHHAYLGVLFYRPDLLRKYGYRQPPETWEELEKMATRIGAGERAKGEKDFWGYVWQGGADEDLTCVGLEWQTSEGGGRIIEDDRTISVNNPAAIRTWERAARWVGTISPPGVLAYSKWDAHNFWGAGKAAFLRSWQSNFSLIKRGWPFSGQPPGNDTQFGLTSMPGGKMARVSALGGNGLAISRTSAHPREALELVRFLLGRDRELLRANEQTAVPKDLELFALPQGLEPYPQPAGLKQRGSSVVARPSVVTGQKYEDVSRAYIQEVHAVLTREKQAPAAASDLARELKKITGFAGGSPGKQPPATAIEEK